MAVGTGRALGTVNHTGVQLPDQFPKVWR